MNELLKRIKSNKYACKIYKPYELIDRARSRARIRAQYKLMRERANKMREKKIMFLREKKK